MRALLLFALALSACAAPSQPANDPVDVEMGDADPMIDPAQDARYGLLAEALVGAWTIESGPWETVWFEVDETVGFYVDNRLMESGQWDVEEGDLFVLPAAGGQQTYTIVERRASGMTFTGADGPFVLERLVE